MTNPTPAELADFMRGQSAIASPGPQMYWTRAAADALDRLAALEASLTDEACIVRAPGSMLYEFGPTSPEAVDRYVRAWRRGADRVRHRRVTAWKETR